MKSLRIAILSQLESPTITEQLVPLLKKRGHTVDIIDLSTVPEENFTSQPEILALKQYNVVYYRSGLDAANSSSRIIQLETFLKKNAVKTVNLHYTKHPLAHAKSYETQQAEKVGLQIPRSVYSSSENFSSLSQILGLPFVCKTDYGTNGIGVYLIKTEDEFNKIQKMHFDVSLIYQAFIPHDSEYRVHVINKEVVCIWKKAVSKNDFRSNVAQGSVMLPAEENYRERLIELAKQTCEAFPFEIFVIDFMLDKNTDQFYFTEINLNPSWELRNTKTTRINVNALTADYFEKLCN